MRDKYIDHEEFKIKIRISTSINILIQQDMFRFGYLKENQSLNPNLFLNHLLPIMHEYRNKKNYEIMKKMQKAKITSNLLEEQLNIINNYYFEDYFDYCDEMINLRISKENMKHFENEAKRTSTYIKSLIIEYSNMRLDNREFLFFNKEYNNIQEAIEKELMISFYHNDVEYNIFPIIINACPINSDLFVFGLYQKENCVFIQSMKLCEIESLHINNKVNCICITENMNKNINNYIFDLEYLENEFKFIGEN